MELKRLFNLVGLFVSASDGTQLRAPICGENQCPQKQKASPQEAPPKSELPYCFQNWGSSRLDLLLAGVSFEGLWAVWISTRLPSSNVQFMMHCRVFLTCYFLGFRFLVLGSKPGETWKRSTTGRATCWFSKAPQFESQVQNCFEVVGLSWFYMAASHGAGRRCICWLILLAELSEVKFRCQCAINLS